MSNLKNFTLSFLLIFSLVNLSSAQNKIAPEQFTKWKTRAEYITFNVIKDSTKIEELERALSFAQLGDLWWTLDPNQSNAWFGKSADIIFFYSSEDKKINQEKYFQTINQILKLVANHNQKQSSRLIKILSDTDKISDKDKNANADNLIEIALQIVKENPQKATESGITAFRIGEPKNFTSLLWELRRYDANLADRLFRAAFAASVSSRNIQMLQNIRYVAFPDLPNFPANLALPQPLKLEVLNFFADYLAQQQARFSTKTISSCSIEAGIVAPLTNYFSDLLPQKAGFVQQALGICLENKNTIVKEINSDSFKNATLEDLLTLADESKDNPLLRNAYLTKAIFTGYSQKKYEIVIKILDDMTKEERENDLPFWEEMRSQSAALLAYNQFQENYAAESLKILENVPIGIRPFAQINFVREFSPKDISTNSFCVERLDDARRNLVKSEKSYAEKVGYWFQIVKLYSDFKVNTEASQTFREIIKALNESLSGNNNDLSISPEAITSTISAQLLDDQENSLIEATSSITQEKCRVQVNFGFLKIALKEYKSLKTKYEKSLTPTSNTKSVVSKQKEHVRSAATVTS